MLDSLTKPAPIRACPIELLVRSEFGPGFDRYVRTHDVTRVVPGVYAHTPAWLRLPPWGQYLARVHAVRWKRPSAVFVFEAAAALLGVPFIGVPAHVHIAADKKGAARISGAVQGHFFTDTLVTTEAGGFTTTTLLETVVDLARVRHPAFGLAVLDHAIRVPGLLRGAISAVNEDRESPRGRANARWAIDRATGIPESVLESVSLAAIEWLGFAAPELQVRFDLGELGEVRVDAYWRAADVIGEADGDAKYRLHDGGVGAALIDEKRREDALRRIARGYARWGWGDCRDPQRLERILTAAACRACGRATTRGCARSRNCSERGVSRRR